MNTSETIGALVAALALAQAKIINVEKNRSVEVKMKTGGKYSFNYTTFDAIVHQIREPLTENGLWFMQYVEDGRMVTKIVHGSGEWMDCGVPMPNLTGSPQDIGSLLSYFRRYSLSAAFGIASEEDSDGPQEGRGEISFKARGEPRHQQDAGQQQSQTPPTPEPEEGYGDWARGFIAKVNDAASESLLDDLIEAEKTFINGSRRVDRTMYEAIGKAITNRRSILGDEVPF